MFMGAVVVQDQMHGQLAGSFPVDLFQKAQPLHMRVVRFGAGDEFALQVVPSCYAEEAEVQHVSESASTHQKMG